MLGLWLKVVGMNMFNVKRDSSEYLKNLVGRWRAFRGKQLRSCAILYIIAKDIKAVRSSLASRNVTAKTSLEARAHARQGN